MSKKPAFTPGSESKGGQNPQNMSGARPEPPGGSGETRGKKEYEKDHIGTGNQSGNAHNRRKVRREGFTLTRPPECIVPTNAEKLVFASPEEAEEYRKAAELPTSWKPEEVEEK